MLRSKTSNAQPGGAKLTKTECESHAEEFVDRLLDPTTPWFRQYWLAAVPYRKAMKEIAKARGLPATVFGSRFDREFMDALEKMDRSRLVALLKTELVRDSFRQEDAQALLRMLDPALWQQAFKGFVREPGPMFQAHRGAKPKIPKRDYRKIAAWGDKLVPVILWILQEQASETQHSIQELLEFRKKDHPQACTFLLHYLPRLRLAIKDKSLLRRAKTIMPRARVIADALAGSDYKSRFSTSLERAREGRRQLKSNPA